MTEKKLARGDKVAWNTSQGETQGTVVREITQTTHVKGYTAKASPAHPEVEVRSAGSGKTAIHAPGALKKVR